MKNYTKITFLSIFLIVTSYCSAQNALILHGNVGVERVNIKVIDTEYGTSTDKNGNYNLILFKSIDDIEILYTCVGYRDSIVTIRPEMLDLDSLEVSFKMKRIDYELPAAGITATKDFYRSRSGNTIVDISFYEDKILVLENKKSKSELHVLNNNGDEISKAKYDSVYNQIFIDFFGNYILLGEKSCQQFYLNEKYKVLPVTTFSRQDFRNKIQNGIFEFNGAYIFRNKTVEPNDFYLRADHNKSQTYFYIAKDDTIHEKQLLIKFFDKEAAKVCQEVFREIVILYYESVEDWENELILGVWNGNMLRLAKTFGLHNLITWYCKIQATELHTTAVKTDSIMYFIDLDRYKIIEIGKDFKKGKEHELKINGEKFFKNIFLYDISADKNYGLFEKDGISYLGLFDIKSGSVGMTTQASNYIYPKVLKINDGHAYGVYFDVEKQRGFINRRRINNE